jgi:spore coat protein A
MNPRAMFSKLHRTRGRRRATINSHTSGMSRRDLLRYGLLVGGGLAVAGKWASQPLWAEPSGPMDSAFISKYVQPLVIPPEMPRSGRIGRGREAINYYEIAVREFYQQILPPGLPTTKVWSYGSIHHPETYNYPAFTIEAKADRALRVKWINDLKDPQTGNFLPHILPVDPTLHWANPPGGIADRDTRPTFESEPPAYQGPVPIVTHVHGAHTHQESDGYPEAWYLPDATNLPGGFATTGTFYDLFKQSSSLGGDWHPGATVFEYPNSQRATTLWYHDHTLGMTRLNVYAGPAGFYLIRGGKSDLDYGLPGPAPTTEDSPRTRYHEIPIVIQDRSFHYDGSLFYPDTREFFDGYTGPYIPDSDVSPIWNPEFFANTMVVNGRTWPYLEVERRRYRFRFLNGCNSRFLILKLVANPLGSRPADPMLPLWQSGADGGFLPEPVEQEQLLMAPAERADVVVDFSHLRPGTWVYLINEGPDEPFGGGEPGSDFPAADPNTTGQVMLFKVLPRRGHDPSLLPEELELPASTPLGPADYTRQVSLNEEDSETEPDFGPRAALLGNLDAAGLGVPLLWRDEVTENPALNTTEVWEIHNFTEDAHPIHVHLVQYEVVNRQPFEGDPYEPEPGERGFKDTVIAYPEEITRIKARFDVPGLFVWHCHIVEHEDNEMMRPYRVET